MFTSKHERRKPSFQFEKKKLKKETKSGGKAEEGTETGASPVGDVGKHPLKADATAITQQAVLCPLPPPPP